jgi:hypothetical protein
MTSHALGLANGYLAGSRMAIIKKMSPVLLLRPFVVLAERLVGAPIEAPRLALGDTGL